MFGRIIDFARLVGPSVGNSFISLPPLIADINNEIYSIFLVKMYIKKYWITTYTL
jgi:hypothetical protein